MKKAYYHLPGLFEFYEFYQVFLPLFYEHREYFYDWCEIGSIYGAPAGTLWGGGRIENGKADAGKVLALTQRYGISARLTFSNSLLREEHLSDPECNALCALFAACPGNGVILHSDLLLKYLREKYPELYMVSSTTKVLADFKALIRELEREEFSFVVPDFRLNKAPDRWKKLPAFCKDKVEFLCNECCSFGCADRKRCYEEVSRKTLGEELGSETPEKICNCQTADIESGSACAEDGKTAEEFHCTSPDAAEGYRFSKAMENPGFISARDIRDIYLPMGFSNFKIEGRGLGSALLLEFILYYMTRPEYQIHVREAIYLDNMLDLF